MMQGNAPEHFKVMKELHTYDICKGLHGNMKITIPKHLTTSLYQKDVSLLLCASTLTPSELA
jgi:hypothetical protein